MGGISQDALAAAVADWPFPQVRILHPSPATRDSIPDTWWVVAESNDPEERKRAALALWNHDFLALIPRYTDALRAALVDVRVAQHEFLDAPSLDYVLRTDEGELRVWTGEDPRTFGDTEPPLFAAVPGAVATFLRQVHAGFAMFDGETSGLAARSAMTTLAARWGRPDTNEILDWFESETFPGTQRLLFLTGDGDDTALFVSPDLPAETAVTYYEPDFELKSFGEALDAFFNRPLDY